MPKLMEVDTLAADILVAAEITVAAVQDPQTKYLQEPNVQDAMATGNAGFAMEKLITKMDINAVCVMALDAVRHVQAQASYIFD